MSLSIWETAQCVCCLLWLVMMSVNMWKTVCLLSAVVFSLNHAHSVFHYWFGGMFLLQRSWQLIVCTPRTTVTPWSDKRCPSHGSPATWLMCPSPRHSPLPIILRWKTTTVEGTSDERPPLFFFFFFLQSLSLRPYPLLFRVNEPQAWNSRWVGGPQPPKLPADQ